MNINLERNTILVVLMGILCLVYLGVETFAPAAVFPALDLSVVSGICLGALVLERYLAGGGRTTRWGMSLVFGVLTFTALPFAAGWVVDATTLVRLGAVGGVAYVVLTFLYTSICQRLDSGRVGKTAPALCAFVLFLAVQGCSGIFL